MSKATLWEIPHYQVQVQLLSRCYKSLLIWVSPGSTLNARPIHPVLFRGPALPPHCPLLYAFIPFVKQNSCRFLFGLTETFMIRHVLFCETLSCSTGRVNQFLSVVLESCCFSGFSLSWTVLPSGYQETVVPRCGSFLSVPHTHLSLLHSRLSCAPLCLNRSSSPCGKSQFNLQSPGEMGPPLMFSGLKARVKMDIIDGIWTLRLLGVCRERAN